MKQQITLLEKAWESGFFYQIRSGIFQFDEYEEVLAVLKDFSALEMDSINKDLLSMIWLIPTFVTWQKERLLSNGMDNEHFDAVYNALYNECEKILGMP